MTHGTILPIVYVVGPLRHESPAQVAAHVMTAQAAAVALARLGFAPYCPHANLAHGLGQIDESDASAINDTFLRLSAAVLLLPGWGNSEGSRDEVEKARRLGLLRFRSIQEASEWQQR
jgi:hypothetical protein